MKLSDAEIEKLIMDLTGKDRQRRFDAERKLRDNKAEIFPQIADFIMHREELLAKQRKKYRWQGPVQFGIAVIFVLIISRKSLPYLSASGIFFSLTCMACLLCMLRNLFRREKLQPEYANALKLLGAGNDPRFVGYILDIMRGGNIHAVEIVEPILFQQLKTLRYTDAALLNKRQRHCLHHLLIYHGLGINAHFDGGKTLAILKALEQVGDRDAYDAVQQVAEFGGSDVVQDVAEECLIYIKVRREMTEPQNTLLRASQNQGGQEELLRAANPNADAQAKTLLRVPEAE